MNLILSSRAKRYYNTSIYNNHQTRFEPQGITVYHRAIYGIRFFFRSRKRGDNIATAISMQDLIMDKSMQNAHSLNEAYLVIGGIGGKAIVLHSSNVGRVQVDIGVVVAYIRAHRDVVPRGAVVLRIDPRITLGIVYHRGEYGN